MIGNILIKLLGGYSCEQVDEMRTVYRNRVKEDRNRINELENKTCAGCEFENNNFCGICDDCVRNCIDKYKAKEIK